MVDAASELIRQEASAEELAGWDASYRVSYPAAPEAAELLDAGRIEAAPPLPERPAVVLSADKPWQSPTPDAHGETSGGMITFAEWLAAQDPPAAPPPCRACHRDAQRAQYLSLSAGAGRRRHPRGRRRGPCRKISPHPLNA
jgi:hypothetical protein